MLMSVVSNPTTRIKKYIAMIVPIEEIQAKASNSGFI